MVQSYNLIPNYTNLRNAFLYKKNIANLKVQSMTYVRQGKPHPIPPHGKGATKTRDVGVSPAIIPPPGEGRGGAAFVFVGTWSRFVAL